ncbi:MAG: selenocysteine-specific translation elongation factor [Thermodesulfobacteria bacterium]|nr:selenocysteine-specific translation elongation factor [Thermodesulfobacteriota bacterium]
MKRLIVGTAGHIDHGKTSLVKCLTGIDTDRLKEEKKRGITIDIGFAKLELPSGILVGIVDVPGHEKFIRNMVAGATGIDLVMLVIAADEGVMPQTREHLEICELLGIKDGFVVITKTDLVDEEWLELVTEDVKEFLKGTFLQDCPIVYFSAVTGKGKEEILKVLEEKAKTLETKPEKKPFRLPIDGVFVIKGFGTVVRGTTISGKISVNQEVVIYPKGIETRVRNIQVHGKNVETAYAGMRTALNLQGISKEDVKRGDVVSEKGVLKPSEWIDISLKVLSSVAQPLKNFENLLFYIGTSEVLGKIVLFGKQELKPGEEDVAQIQLQKPVVCWRKDRFILRRASTNTTVGGGEVLNPVSHRRKRTKPWEKKELQFLKSATDEELVVYIVEKKGFFGIPVEELKITTSLFGEEFEKIISTLKNEVFLLKEGEKQYIFSQKAKAELKEKILEVLRKFHQANPFSPGITKELLKSRISSLIPDVFYNTAIEELIKEGKIEREKELIYLAEFKYIDAEQREKLKKEVEEKFLREGLTPRDFEDVLLDFKEKYKAVKELSQALLREGTLVKLTDKLVFHRKVLEDVEKRVIEFFKKNKEMSLSDFRGLFDVKISRKYLIPLVEYLDKQKITLRIGDKRVLRKKLK